MEERWAVVNTWNDGDPGEDDVDFMEMCGRLVEELALVTADELCRTGKKNYAHDDNPRLRDASILIDASEQDEELQGLVELLMDVSALPGVLLSLHKAMDDSWEALSAKNKCSDKPSHAVLGAAWHADERLSGFANAMQAAWTQVLNSECEQATKPTAPPEPVLQVLAGFEPLLESWGRHDGVVWPSVQAFKQALTDQAGAAKAKAREAAKARLAKLQPGVNCCYECEEDDHEDEYTIKEGVEDLLWAKEQEGYSYGDAKPSQVLFCEVCYEDFKRY